jgi:hypothetical protein
MSLSRAAYRIDSFLAGSTWWRWRLKRAEERLENELARDVRDPFAIAAAHVNLKRAQFAVEYGRSVKPGIEVAVERAAASGVPTKVLRLAIINLDLRVNDDGRLRVRQNWWLTGLAVSARAVVVAAVAVTTLQIATSRLPLRWVVPLLLSYTVIFYVGTYVWDLFGFRAFRAAKELAEILEASPIERIQIAAPVAEIPSKDAKNVSPRQD